MAADGQNGLASSFTDLMTSLAIIFILLLCAAHNSAQVASINTRDSILEALIKELADFIQRGIEIKADEKDPLAVLILVPEGLLEFKVNKSEIPQKGVEFLRPFIPRLANIVYSEKFREEINTIVVEGHTDSTGPEQRKDQHNWELSQRRSMAVVAESLRILEEEHGEGSDESSVRTYFVKLLSASGRGSAELIRDEDGAENRDKSRRVQFRIRVRSLEQKTIGAISEALGDSDR